MFAHKTQIELESYCNLAATHAAPWQDYLICTVTEEKVAEYTVQHVEIKAITVLVRRVPFQ